jgi:hypothetical protein
MMDWLPNLNEGLLSGSLSASINGVSGRKAVGRLGETRVSCDRGCH